MQNFPRLILIMSSVRAQNFGLIYSNVKIIALLIQLKVNTEKISILGFMNQNENIIDTS